MIVIQLLFRSRGWVVYNPLRIILTTFGFLVAVGISEADDIKMSRLPLKDIISVLKLRAEAIESLFVEYEVDTPLLDKPEVVKRYLFVGALLKAERRIYAFKGVKQYYRMVRSKQLEPLAPDVEPDYNAIPGGLELQKKLDAQRRRGGKTDNKAALEAKKGAALGFDTEAAFDGDTLRRTSFGSTNADVTKREQLPPGKTWFIQDYVRNIGMKVPDALKSNNSGEGERLPDALEQDGYEIQEKEEQVYGASCIVVSRPGRDKLWLDPRLGYALRQRELYDAESGILRERMQNQNYIEAKPGIWLPQMCIRDECGYQQAPPAYRGKPLIRYVYTVKRLGVNNVPDELFILKIKPGTVVADQTVRTEDGLSDYPVVYVMPADARRLDQVVQESLAREKEWNSGGRRNYVVLSVMAGLLVLLLALYAVRRFRSQKT